MKHWKNSLLLLSVVAIVALVSAMLLIRRGFRATSEPSTFENVFARTTRNFAIPDRERNEKNPLEINSKTLTEACEHFMAQCSICHGIDGRGQTQMGRSLYPRVPDLLSIGMAGRSNMTPRVCCSRCTEVSHGTFERCGHKRAEAVLMCGEVFANRFLDVGATCSHGFLRLLLISR